jgi:hypothetical protein
MKDTKKSSNPDPMYPPPRKRKRVNREPADDRMVRDNEPNRRIR